jgi:hypothetical protein
MNGAMASKVNDIVAEIAAGLASPRVIAAIDKAISEFQQGQLSLYELRRAAARLHGEPSATPTSAPASPPLLKVPHHSGAAGQTMRALVASYTDHADSPYRHLRYRTRQNYDSLIRRIVDDCGDAMLADLKARDIELLHERWKKSGKTMGHSVATMLRALVNFGASKLGNAECERLSVVLHNMRFKVEKRQSQGLTEDQAKQIISMAHTMGLHSIALAQALQFDCKLQQKDAIGEWVPLAELGTPSDVIDGNLKWLHGVRWTEIDRQWILRHTTSRGQKPVEIDLKDADLVTSEFGSLIADTGDLPTSGPMIVCEKTGLPWRTHSFRAKWREIADACGFPKSVKNMDSRPSTRARMAGEGGLIADAQIVRATDRPL